MKKHKIALLVEAPDVEGGIQTAAHRHATLMSNTFKIIPVAFGKSATESEWAGVTEKIHIFGQDSYMVRAADLKNDHRWSGTSSIEVIRQDIRFRSYADHLIDIIRREGISLIHAFGAFHQRGVIAAYAAAKCKIPYVLSLRGVDLETRMFDTSLAPLGTSISSASQIVCVSEDSRSLVANVFKPSCPVHVVRNHFDPTLFDDHPVEIPLLRHTDIPVLGCFGKFRRVMGLDFLLDAFAELTKKRDAVLLLGGSIQKREVEYYNRRLETCAASSSIIRAGSIPHSAMLGFLRRCSAVVFPSISDASPNKILEAMYAGVPIISTATGGIPELVKDSVDALLVRPRSAREIVVAIERILDDDAFAKELARNAYQRVLNDHHIDHEGPLWRDVYHAALTQSA